MDFVGKVMALLFNTLSKFVIAFLPRSKCLSISWLQSPSAMILEPKKIKSVTVYIFSPSICHEVVGPDAMILVFWMLSFKQAFSLSSFTFIKRFFSSSLSAISIHIGIARSYDNSMFNLLRNCQAVFHSGCTIVYPHPQFMSSSFSTALPTLFIFHYFDCRHPNGYEVVSYCSFFFDIFLIISDVGHLFLCFLAICISSLEKCLFTLFA